MHFESSRGQGWNEWGTELKNELCPTDSKKFLETRRAAVFMILILEMKIRDNGECPFNKSQVVCVLRISIFVTSGCFRDQLS